MTAINRLKIGSGILLFLTFASWVIALGGLGAINWYVCSDTTKTVAEIGNSTAVAAPLIAGVFQVPSAPVTVDVAVCSRTYRWEWWTLFFEFAIVVSAAVATLMPERLVRARFPLANLLTAASVLIMIAINSNIGYVWLFWDTQKLFSQWDGVLQKLYYSASALVAGWILVVIFNIIWIGFVLDHEASPAAAAPAKEGDKPITGDVEAANTTK